MAHFIHQGIPPEGTAVPAVNSRWTSSFDLRPTFYSLLGGKGIEIPESHRKWLELQKDYRLQSLVNANPEELHKQELLKFQALRAEQDLKAAALKTGQDLGEVKLQGGPPRKLPPMATNVTDSEAFENAVNNSRVVDLMKQRDLELAQEAASRRGRQKFHADLNYPHTI